MTVIAFVTGYKDTCFSTKIPTLRLTFLPRHKSSARPLFDFPGQQDINCGDAFSGPTFTLVQRSRGPIICGKIFLPGDALQPGSLSPPLRGGCRKHRCGKIWPRPDPALLGKRWR